MAEGILPTLAEVDQEALRWRQYVIDKNVRLVATAIQTRGKLRGSTMLEWVDSTMSTRQNIIDCIIGRLEAMEPQGVWKFRESSDWITTIEWSSNPFPKAKPWWKIW